MKKFFVILLAVTALFSCQKKIPSPDTSNIFEIQQETLQPDPYSILSNTTTKAPVYTSTTFPENQTAESISVTTSDETSTSFNTASTTFKQDSEQSDPLGGGAFSYDEDGAVQFIQEPDNDKLIISAAQALFESACRTQWSFTVGCPYTLDMGSVIQNDFGWNYYKITDENIKSITDVENDYYNVFSNHYPNEDLKVLYIEHNGNVYAFNGQREMNIYYSVSRIKEIQSRTDDEIFFTVENQFEGTDMNPDEPYSEEETFSVIIEGDKWKAGQFRLPY